MIIDIQERKNESEAPSKEITKTACNGSTERFMTDRLIKMLIEERTREYRLMAPI